MAARFVESRIRDGKVTLFVKEGCCYCRNAKEMLKNLDPGCLQVFDITDLEDVQDYLQQTTRQKTREAHARLEEVSDSEAVTVPGLQDRSFLLMVPCVFIGKHCIGGLSDLQNMWCNIPKMLQKTSAFQ